MNIREVFTGILDDAFSSKGVESKVRILEEEWGSTVYILNRPDDGIYDADKKWVVRNHTDEGLGAKELKSYEAGTLKGALDKAVSEEL